MGNIDEKILDHKLTVKQVLPSYKIESFQYQVLECWYKIKSQNPETVQEIRNEYVFFNKFFVFDGVPISPEMVGVENKFSELKLSQILNSEGKLLCQYAPYIVNLTLRQLFSHTIPCCCQRMENQSRKPIGISEAAAILLYSFE